MSKQERIHGLLKLPPSAPEFRRLFSRSLKEFWSAYTGFDVIAFEHSITGGLGTPDGVSLRDWLTANYGPEGMSMIAGLLGIGEGTTK